MSSPRARRGKRGGASHRLLARGGLALGILTAGLLGAVRAGATDAESEATLLKQSPLIVSAESNAVAWLETACSVLLTVAGRAEGSPIARDEARVVPAIRRCARLAPVNHGGPRHDRVAAALPGYRCMALAGGDDPVPIRSQPRAGSRRLGLAQEPVIVADPVRVVNGHARMLRPDGRTGWIPRDRLRAWIISAAPGLNCLPIRKTTDGSLGVTYVRSDEARDAASRPGAPDAH
ncbi:hypothetical protein LNAOJCKE_4146 [Methylorubrum aminovorans]|uniref:SH3 domain-containing protein n=1 Tax=Methylorubrum aminovorans TaxID=269069 RepID=A0ABQ4UK84_9HYPH|nr:hypothetical protein [Methylorubrum aminovorans]GJE66922.1 hypothetical protein LNAOJCKE_4146 [Methylorubrum aminovorans]GMA77036.1 hypothetical protein GCM10025880_34530 [Methylorubrum aminovorans]